MSSGFSANQYDNVFKSQRLQNWCATKSFKERPSAHVGHTTFIADNRGHLLPEVKKGNTWPDFKGTWDLPARIPAHHINTTARSVEGLSRLRSWGLCPPQRSQSLSGRGSRNTHVRTQTSEDVDHPAVDPSTPTKTPESITGSESCCSLRAEDGSPAQQDLHPTNTDKPMCETQENYSVKQAA